MEERTFSDFLHSNNFKNHYPNIYLLAILVPLQATVVWLIGILVDAILYMANRHHNNLLPARRAARQTLKLARYSSENCSRCNMVKLSLRFAA